MMLLPPHFGEAEDLEHLLHLLLVALHLQLFVEPQHLFHRQVGEDEIVLRHVGRDAVPELIARSAIHVNRALAILEIKYIHTLRYDITIIFYVIFYTKLILLFVYLL